MPYTEKKWLDRQTNENRCLFIKTTPGGRKIPGIKTNKQVECDVPSMEHTDRLQVKWKVMMNSYKPQITNLLLYLLWHSKHQIMMMGKK